MTNHYELLYLVPANYTEEELVPIKEKVKELIAKFKGEITFEDTYGKKKLAYPIGKNFAGYYLLYEFYLPGEKLSDLNRGLKLTKEVLRHIIVAKKFQSASDKAAEKQAAEKRAENLESKIDEKEKEKEKEKDKDKIQLKDLDQKLDEILEGDII